MRNIKITVSYDGTDFSGWQIQPNQPTIQGTLTDVLEKLTQSRMLVQGAGRTDAGVHALGQVANFKTESSMEPEDFQRAFNALLPDTIRVVAAEEVAPEFHARWNALAKTYRYRIFRGRVVSPFSWRYVQQESAPLNFEAMAEVAQQFVGEHDFTTFSAAAGSEEEDQEQVFTRMIYRSELLRVPSAVPGSEDEEWIYIVRGKSFLRYMVRKMVGTLVSVGRGKLIPSAIPSLFEGRDRTKCPATMPPQGLCLMDVEYE